MYDLFHVLDRSSTYLGLDHPENMGANMSHFMAQVGQGICLFNTITGAKNEADASTIQHQGLIWGHLNPNPAGDKSR
jgi:hypothetical protein